MNISKNNIIKYVAKKSSISTKDGSKFLESFLSHIKEKSKLKTVKLTGFGSFSIKKTAARLGRNPKTLESYLISEFNKLNFKSSNKIRKRVN